MTVAVAMPYYGCPDLVSKAVGSVLAQTVRDLVCVVIGDGQTPPLSAKDNRLVLYVLPENRGTYFAQQLVLLASPHAWYAPHGADDWSEPDHLERLLVFGATAAVPRTVWIHSGEKVTEQAGQWEVGVFSADRLRSLGGFNPAERVEQDTLMVDLLQLGGVSRSRQPTYHYVRHSGSLFTSPATGWKSMARNRARQRRTKILAQARRLRTPQRIKAYRDQLVPAHLAAELNQHAHALRAML